MYNQDTSLIDINGMWPENARANSLSEMQPKVRIKRCNSGVSRSDLP